MAKEFNQTTAIGKPHCWGTVVGHQRLGMVTDWIAGKVTPLNMEAIEQ